MALDSAAAPGHAAGNGLYASSSRSHRSGTTIPGTRGSARMRCSRSRRFSFSRMPICAAVNRFDRSAGVSGCGSIAYVGACASDAARHTIAAVPWRITPGLSAGPAERSIERPVGGHFPTAGASLPAVVVRPHASKGLTLAPRTCSSAANLLDQFPDGADDDGRLLEGDPMTAALGDDVASTARPAGQRVLQNAAPCGDFGSGNRRQRHVAVLRVERCLVGADADRFDLAAERLVEARLRPHPADDGPDVRW